MRHSVVYNRSSIIDYWIINRTRHQSNNEPIKSNQIIYLQIPTITI